METQNGRGSGYRAFFYWNVVNTFFCIPQAKNLRLFFTHISNCFGKIIFILVNQLKTKNRTNSEQSLLSLPPLLFPCQQIQEGAFIQNWTQSPWDPSTLLSRTTQACHRLNLPNRSGWGAGLSITVHVVLQTYKIRKEEHWISLQRI